MTRLRHLLLPLAFALPFSAQAATQCQNLPAGATGTYCVYPGDTQNNTDIVYYFLPQGKNPSLWGETDSYPEQVRQYWLREELAAPTVVSLTSPILAAPETMVQKVMPAIEASLGGLKGQRIVVGESYGGFNAVQLALRTDLFDKMAALCTPMTLDLTPFSTQAQVEAHVKASAVYHFLGDGSLAKLEKALQDSLNLFKVYFPNTGDWQQADPLNLAAVVGSRHHFMAAHVEAGFHDTRSLYDANEEFVRRLTRAGLQVDWRPQSGGHCDVDVASFADFLAY